MFLPWVLLFWPLPVCSLESPSAPARAQVWSPGGGLLLLEHEASPDAVKVCSLCWPCRGLTRTSRSRSRIPKTVLPSLPPSFSPPSPPGHTAVWWNFCPPTRRRTLALLPTREQRGAGFHVVLRFHLPPVRWGDNPPPQVAVTPSLAQMGDARGTGFNKCWMVSFVHSSIHGPSNHPLSPQCSRGGSAPRPSAQPWGAPCMPLPQLGLEVELLRWILLCLWWGRLWPENRSKFPGI